MVVGVVWELRKVVSWSWRQARRLPALILLFKTTTLLSLQTQRKHTVVYNHYLVVYGIMDLPPLSQDQLSSISSAATPSELYEKLSQYEGEALLASDNQGNPELLSLFYVFFFFSHLLTEQM